MRVRPLAFAVVLALSGAFPASADDAKPTEKDADDEAPVAESAVPEVVRAAAHRILGAASATGWTKENEDGVLLYEVEYAVEGGKGSISFTAEGEFLEREEHVAVVPAAVLKRVGLLHPGASVVSSTAVRAKYFEIKVKVGDKTHEVVLDAAGRVFGNHDGDDDDDEDDAKEHAKPGMR